MFRKDRAPFWLTLFPATTLFFSLFFLTGSPAERSSSSPGPLPEESRYVEDEGPGEPRETEIAIVEGLGWIERHQFAVEIEQEGRVELATVNGHVAAPAAPASQPIGPGIGHREDVHRADRGAPGAKGAERLLVWILPVGG